jgi:hypothetical protein
MEQHHELESMGILLQTKLPAFLSWMTDGDKSLVLQLYMAGEAGTHKTAILKFEKTNPETVLNITVRDLAEWVSDKQGRPSHLTLTWKGEELGKLVCQVAKHESRAEQRNKAALLQQKQLDELDF